MSRSYTILLDPPTYAEQQQSIVRSTHQTPRAEITLSSNNNDISTSNRIISSSTPIPIFDEVSPVEPKAFGFESVTPDQIEEKFNKTARVRQGDTLWIIAEQIKQTYTHLNLYQIMWAIFEHNPHAFVNQDINGLMAGQILDIPSEDEIAQVSPEVALNQIEWHQQALFTGQSSPLTASQASMIDEQSSVSLKNDDQSSITSIDSSAQQAVTQEIVSSGSPDIDFTFRTTGLFSESEMNPVQFWEQNDGALDLPTEEANVENNQDSLAFNNDSSDVAAKPEQIQSEVRPNVQLSSRILNSHQPLLFAEQWLTSQADASNNESIGKAVSELKQEVASLQTLLVSRDNEINALSARLDSLQQSIPNLQANTLPDQNPVTSSFGDRIPTDVYSPSFLDRIVNDKLSLTHLVLILLGLLAMVVILFRQLRSRVNRCKDAASDRGDIDQQVANKVPDKSSTTDSNEVEKSHVINFETTDNRKDRCSTVLPIEEISLTGSGKDIDVDAEKMNTTQPMSAEGGECSANNTDAMEVYLNIKLELARAYIAKGEYQKAKIILDEIVQQGNAAQVESANQLIQFGR